MRRCDFHVAFLTFHDAYLGAGHVFADHAAVVGGGERGVLEGALVGVAQQWQAERTFSPSGADMSAAKAGWADAISRTIRK